MLENGFVLLTSTSFDNDKLINDLQTQWQITVKDAISQDNSFIFSVDDYK